MEPNPLTELFPIIIAGNDTASEIAEFNITSVIPQKECNKCGAIKKLTEYHKDSNSSDGHYTICKKCKNTGSREYFHKRKLKKSLKRTHEQLIEFEKGWRQKALEIILAQTNTRDCADILKKHVKFYYYELNKYQ